MSTYSIIMHSALEQNLGVCIDLKSVVLRSCILISRNYFFSLHCSVIVMDYDEFSADDFIGATRVKLYECLYAPNHNISIRRLLDDNIVSCGAPDIQDSHTLPSVMYTYQLASSPGLLSHPSGSPSPQKAWG